MGQVAESADSLEKAAAEMLALTGDRELTDELVAGIPSIKPDMIASYVRIMTICAQYLTLSNATQSANPTLAEMAKKYINTNLSKKLSITEICDYLGCSKSTLLALFKKQYGITVNHYVTEKRLELARHKLGDSRLTIYEIAAMTGFADQSYFSKVFSARFGISPSEYRHKLLNFDTKSE
jgi:transcriptional regulator GlxA family with amidase domain